MVSFFTSCPVKDTSYSQTGGTNSSESDEKKALEALTPQMNETFEHIQVPSHTSHGIELDERVDRLFRVMARYEIPPGLASKLMQLSNFDSREFFDDSDDRGRSR